MKDVIREESSPNSEQSANPVANFTSKTAASIMPPMR